MFEQQAYKPPEPLPLPIAGECHELLQPVEALDFGEVDYLVRIPLTREHLP